MTRIAKQIDYERLEELKKMIEDSHYLESAILWLAQDLTEEIADIKGLNE